MNLDSPALLQTVNENIANSQELLRSLRNEYDCLRKWDTAQLNGALTNRHELVHRLQASLERLVSTALPAGETVSGHEQLKQRVRYAMSLACQASQQMETAWETLQDLGEQLDEQHRLNARLVVLGRQVTEQAIGQLLGEQDTAASTRPLYSDKGLVPSSAGQSRLIGIA